MADGGLRSFISYLLNLVRCDICAASNAISAQIFKTLYAILKTLQMIQLFTENLPYKLSEQMTFEYNNRINDINFFLSGRYDYYSHLKKDIETIRLLLALSIFYKRVLSNFDSATKFTSRIIFKSEAKSVQLGTYDLSAKEIFKLNKTVLTFKRLMEDYSIPLSLFEYLETKELLRKIKIYKDSLGRKTDNGQSF